jgi:hypothetical protein
MLASKPALQAKAADQKKIAKLASNVKKPKSSFIFFHQEFIQKLKDGTF